MKPVFAISLFWALLAWGCTIADDDRCPKGLIYLPEDKMCLLPEEDAGPEEDGGPDPGEGFWQTCTSITECEEVGLDFCVAMPNEDGNCTYTDCESLPDGCPAGYICCNCTAFDFIGEAICGPESWRDSFIDTQCDCE